VIGTVTKAALVLTPGIVLVWGSRCCSWVATALVRARLGRPRLVDPRLVDPGPVEPARLAAQASAVGYLPHLPSDPMCWGAFSIELALGLGMIAVGLLGYRRRDIAGR